MRQHACSPLFLGNDEGSDACLTAYVPRRIFIILFTLKNGRLREIIPSSLKASKIVREGEKLESRYVVLIKSNPVIYTETSRTNPRTILFALRLTTVVDSFPVTTQFAACKCTFYVACKVCCN